MMIAPEQDRTTWSSWRKSTYSGATNGGCVEIAWRKSSFSAGGNGDCVEIAWQKSSFSGGGNGNCVEVAFVVEAVAVRDSKHPAGPRLEFPEASWRRFLR